MRNIAKVHAQQADKSWGDLYYHVISEKINEMDFKFGVELGVAFGGHSEFILNNTKVEKIYGVDSYLQSPSSTDNFFWNSVPYSQEDYENLHEFTIRRLSKFGDRFFLIRESTSSALNKVNQDLDFIFIDALHTYDGVLTDLENWFPKIKSGGMISGHDYHHPNFPGVTLAVNRFVQNVGAKLVECDGHVWYFLKP